MNIIVLEHPRIASEERFNDIANTPLWSCLMGGYAAAALSASGHQVTFMDCTVDGRNFDEVLPDLLSCSPDLLAVNAVYIWENTDALFDLFKRLRKEGFSGHINLFGFYPTLACDVILNAIEEVDTVTVGECEKTLVELADALARGRSIDGIMGLAAMDGGAVRMNAPRKPAEDPGKFPFPARVEGGFSTASVLASRGCYNHCSFCPVPSFYNRGPLWRGRNPDDIVREIKILMDQGYSDFYFADPNFVGPGARGRRRTLELMDKLRPLAITFGMETRPGDLDDEIMESLVSSGFSSLLLGIESGSAALLERISKGSSLSSGERAIELCRKYGVEPEIGFLMFLPDSELSDLSHNIDFLEKNNLLDRLDRTANLLSHCHIVLMGTKGYGEFEQEGRLNRGGYLGFEGQVRYRDPKVAWVRDTMVPACLSILKTMSLSDSPIYWEKDPQSAPMKRVNDYLVQAFRQRLVDAQEQEGQLSGGQTLRERMLGEIQDAINWPSVV